MVLTKIRSVDLFLFKMSADILSFILDQKSLLLYVRYYSVLGPTCIGVCFLYAWKDPCVLPFLLFS